MATVVVTGGTGFIGQRLVKALLRRGDKVIVTSRKASAARAVFESTIEIVEWDGVARDAIRGVISRADAVMHLAGANIGERRWTEARMKNLRASRTVPTEILASVMSESKPSPRVFVSMSAVGIYGMRSDNVELSEGSECGSDFLANLCVDWEAAANAARGAGVRVTHPRMGIVLGKEGGVLAQTLPIFRMGLGGPIGAGTQYIGWIHIDDAVAALLFSLDHESLSGAYNVTAPTPVTMNEYAATLGRVLRRPVLMRVPSFALKVAMGSNLAELVLTGQRAIPRVLLERKFSFEHPALERALSSLLSSS